MIGHGVGLFAAAGRQPFPAWAPAAATWAFGFADDRYWRDGVEVDFATAVSFSRASTAWGGRLPSALAEYASGAPRRDATGLLIEAATTRKTGFAETPFTNWALIGATRTALAGTYFGLFSNVALVVSGGQTWHRLQASKINDFVAGTKYSFSVLLYSGHAAASGKAMIDIRNHTTGAETLITGDLGALVVSAVAAGTVADLRETDLGEGWWLIEGVHTAGANGDYKLGVGPFSLTSGENVGVAGGMMESALSPTGIVLGTGNLEATRAAETATAAVSGVRSLSADFALDHMPAGDQVIVQADDGTADNRARIVYQQSTGTLRGQVSVGGVAQCDLEIDDYVIGTQRQAALTWATDDFAAAADGLAAVTDTSGSDLTGLTTLRFGHGVAGADQHSVRIVSAAAYRSRIVPDAIA